MGVSRHAPTVAGGGSHVLCDLTDAQATQRMMDAVKPEVVIHAQALSDVDRCELEPEAAQALNVRTTAHVCNALANTGAWLIALGTDYVFDGIKGRPYTEADAPHPVSVYGQSKLAAEELVRRYARGVVVRVSTLFGPGRANFCDTIVQRLTRGERIEAFRDQTTSPTYTDDVAEGVEQLLRVFVAEKGERHPRLYHMTNAGGCTRVEFATQVAANLRKDASLIRAISIRDQQRPAPRPAYSALASEHLTAVIGRALRPWQEALSSYLARQR